MNTLMLARCSRSFFLASLGSSAAFAQLPAYEAIFSIPDEPNVAGELDQIFSVHGGEDSGWVCIAVRNMGQGQFRGEFHGVLSAGDPQGPRVLRVPASLSGIDQFEIAAPSLAAERIGYLSRETGEPLMTSAWLDDEVVAQVGQIAGSSPYPWKRLDRIQVATDGTAVVEGVVAGPRAQGLLLRVPDGEVLLETGAPVPGISETIRLIQSFDRAPDGSSVLAVVTLHPSGRRAVLLDGAVYTAPNGVVFLEGESAVGVTPSGSSAARLGGFSSPNVSSSGDLSFRAVIEDSTGSGALGIGVRNGLQVRDPSDDLEGSAFSSKPVYATEQGAIVWGGSFVRFPMISIDSQKLFATSYSVDADGDGAVDPGWRVGAVSFVGDSIAVSGDGAIYGNARVSPPFGSSEPDLLSIVRVSLLQGGAVICQGVPNSTAQRARLFSLGVDQPAFNSMELIASGLPASSLALPLLSLASGPGVVPTGSVGQLCLGGAIGRAVGSTMVSDEFGNGESRIFLNVLPQPDGTVPAQAGETWYAQLWYRDAPSPGSTSNFSDAVAIRFR